jgi:dTDP-4-dehydrorhamnose reductase
MMDFSTVLFTGGTGLLGRHMKLVIPQAFFPVHAEFDITDLSSMSAYLNGKTVSTIFHAAAFTSPPKINENPKLALDVNIVGTANLVQLCMNRNIKLLYVSTDYVFKGDRGMYKEDDPVLPANKYAWSKLGGECAVRMYDNSLIIRTSFGDTIFPYEKAFVDQWTSRLRVDVLAKKLVKLLQSNLTGTVHVGGKRQTVMDYAKSVSPGKAIGTLSLKDVTFVAPKDTSLDTSRYASKIGENE